MDFVEDQTLFRAPERLAHAHQIANVLQPLIDACQAMLEFWHDLIGDFPNSWGWSIILLTFTVRCSSCRSRSRA